jgi:hypothetical protein
MLGFVLQLVAYAWAHAAWWLLAYAAALAAGSFVVVPAMAKGIGRRFYAAAERAARARIQESDRRG